MNNTNVQTVHATAHAVSSTVTGYLQLISFVNKSSNQRTLNKKSLVRITTANSGPYNKNEKKINLQLKSRSITLLNVKQVSSEY